MRERYADFVDVRTHGSLGDIGADGLRLHNRKLYACYGPQTPDPTKIKRKFLDDLEKAITKRGEHFTTFVFVHNDRRDAIHPEVSVLLNQARIDHANLGFEQLGPNHLYRELCRLDRDAIADLLECDFPTIDRLYRVGPSDLEPLLAHLVTNRRSGAIPASAREVPPHKLDYNELGPEDRDDLIQAMRHAPLVEDYYQARTDITERDEVAEGFNAYYRDLRQEYQDPAEMIWKLQEYVTGNARQSREQERAVMVILAYFFETCDVFEEPPTNWRATRNERASA
ncbi:hypothetical protein Ahu01nite_028490 [Winogradskya humida]|uniref:ABC-three component systems C-terminal domain-containing protein n=2 Tax=Winogradskya humida TaxID=113566 RepID=A0ABQ3ZNG6_9ACTN|nr:hypothetical protein Ahu01nite_028490 [Actinoplanes humidus]